MHAGNSARAERKQNRVEMFPPSFSNTARTYVPEEPDPASRSLRPRGKSQGRRPLSASPFKSHPRSSPRKPRGCSREPPNSARFLLQGRRAGRKAVPAARRPIPHKAARPRRQPITSWLAGRDAGSQWEVAARARPLLVAPAPSLPPAAFHSAPGGGSEIRGPM